MYSFFTFLCCLWIPLSNSFSFFFSASLARRSSSCCFLTWFCIWSQLREFLHGSIVHVSSPHHLNTSSLRVVPLGLESCRRVTADCSMRALVRRSGRFCYWPFSVSFLWALAGMPVPLRPTSSFPSPPSRTCGISLLPCASWYLCNYRAIGWFVADSFGTVRLHDASRDWLSLQMSTCIDEIGPHFHLREFVLCKHCVSIFRCHLL